MIEQGELVVDNFAGGGGASMGMEWGLNRHVDIAINHDPQAIDMHRVNHPETKHYCESVWDVDPAEATDGKPVGLAWFSPDCKHFSKAKGGKPVDKRVRGLAWIVMRWATQTNMRMFMLENVEEFIDWGPIDNYGKPIKSKKSQTFDAFVDMLTVGVDENHPALDEIRDALPGFNPQPLIDGLGYDVDWKILKACDYGAPTIRKRLFMVGRKDGKPIVWPDPTHGEGEGLIPYLTAADVIDWSIPCTSIFNRKRPLVPRTMERIFKGIKKYVIDADEPFIVPEHGQVPFITEHANASSQRNMAANEPLRTQCAGVKGGHFALVSAHIAKHYTGVTGSDIQKPLHTVTAKDHNALVTSHMVKFKGNNTGFATNSPMHTLTQVGYIGEVRAFLMQYYGTLNVSPATEPMRTVTTKSRLGLVTVRGTDYQIVDIGMRMLTPSELFNAQGFDDSYVIDIDSSGNKTTIVNQVARCGNAVCPPVAEALVKANMEVSNERVEGLHRP